MCEVSSEVLSRAPESTEAYNSPAPMPFRHLELRAAALTSTKFDRRFDLEGVFNIAGTRNHADVWFSYMQRQTDFFGIGPLSPTRSKPVSPQTNAVIRDRFIATLPIIFRVVSIRRS